MMFISLPLLIMLLLLTSYTEMCIVVWGPYDDNKTIHCFNITLNVSTVCYDIFIGYPPSSLYFIFKNNF